MSVLRSSDHARSGTGDRFLVVDPGVVVCFGRVAGLPGVGCVRWQHINIPSNDPGVGCFAAADRRAEAAPTLVLLSLRNGGCWRELSCQLVAASCSGRPASRLSAAVRRAQRLRGASTLHCISLSHSPPMVHARSPLTVRMRPPQVPPARIHLRAVHGWCSWQALLWLHKEGGARPSPCHAACV